MLWTSRYLAAAVEQLREGHEIKDEDLARLFDVPRRGRRRVVDELLAAVDLTDAADRLVGTYSGGMVRRLELAQALVNRPRLLVLDEPIIGLDPVARAAVWARVQALVDADEQHGVELAEQSWKVTRRRSS